MGELEISTYISQLATEQKVSASTQNQALCALLFLYGQVLERDLDLMDIARAKSKINRRSFSPAKRLPACSPDSKEPRS